MSRPQIDQQLRPPFPYYGGKQTLAHRIVELLPEHEHYVEPYAGSLAVLLAKDLSRMETVNDIDAELVAFWRTLRDRFEELARACALTPHGRAEHAAAWNDPPSDDPVESARRTWVKLSQGRGASLRESKTGWRYFVNPRGSSAGMPAYLRGYVGRMEPVLERLQHVTLECLPALEMIDKYGRHPGVLLYVDPPYLGETRGYGANYKHEMRTDGQHRELAAALRACRATVMLSGYASPLYDELFGDWFRMSFAASTGNGVVDNRGRTEVLWSNVELGIQGDLFAALGAS